MGGVGIAGRFSGEQINNGCPSDGCLLVGCNLLLGPTVRGLAHIVSDDQAAPRD